MKVIVEKALASSIDEILPHFRAYQAGYPGLSSADEEQTRAFLLNLLFILESEKGESCGGS